MRRSEPGTAFRHSPVRLPPASYRKQQMKRSVLRVAVLACALSAALPFVLAAAEAPKPDARNVEFRWGVKIALRDGAQLNATLYTPRDQAAPAPCIFTLTPYIAQSYHDRGMYFAEHGYP